MRGMKGGVTKTGRLRVLQGLWPVAGTISVVFVLAGWGGPFTRAAPAEVPTLESEVDGRLAQEGAEESTDQGVVEAVASRAANRAFEGAPPTIPHPVDEADGLICDGCHTDGSAGVVYDPMMSHSYRVSCTQCHVPGANEQFGEPPEMHNGFQGRRRWEPVATAGPGGPPPIPHTTLMRTNCLSCHGELGRAGLRTPHPERVSCTQCHAPSAALDQR